MSKYRAQFASAIEQVNVTASSPLRIADALLRQGGIAVAEDSEALAEIIEAAKAVWNEFIVPIDIPNVPDVFEEALETAAWQAIELGIRAVHAKVKSLQHS